MRYPTLLGTLLLIWSGQALSQTAASEGFLGMAVTSSLLVVYPEEDVPTIGLRRTFPTLKREEVIATFLKDSFEPGLLSSRRQPRALRFASGPSAVKYRFTSDSVEVRYLFRPAISLRADIGENHGPRPMWNGFMNRRTTGGPLHNTQATAGIGISF
jgi:hypothetical protein